RITSRMSARSSAKRTRTFELAVRAITPWWSGDAGHAMARWSHFRTECQPRGVATGPPRGGYSWQWGSRSLEQSTRRPGRDAERGRGRRPSLPEPSGQALLPAPRRPPGPAARRDPPPERDTQGRLEGPEPGRPGGVGWRG